MKTTCPSCGEEIEINIGALIGAARSDAKTAAARENAKQPRPNARGKRKPREEKPSL